VRRRPHVAASIQAGQVEGMVTDITFALRAEQAHEAKILLGFGDLVKDFHTHVIYATTRRLRGGETRSASFSPAGSTPSSSCAPTRRERQAAMEVLELPEAIASPTYDRVMPAFSTDGKFDARRWRPHRSFVELELLPSEPKEHAAAVHRAIPAEESIRANCSQCHPAQAGSILFAYAARWVPAFAGRTVLRFTAVAQAFAVMTSAGAAAGAAHRDQDRPASALVEVGALEHGGGLPGKEVVQRHVARRT